LLINALYKFQDALIDLVIGLGVHHSSILLSLPSTASKFELKDPTKNTPRSPAVGFPTTITRQQVHYKITFPPTIEFIKLENIFEISLRV
jgi:hypothetical protein